MLVLVLVLITLLIKYLLLLLFQKIITSLRPIAQQLPLSQLDEADQFDKPPKDKTLQKICYDKIMKPSLDAYIFQLQTKADAPGPDLLQKFIALTDKA